MELVWCLAMHTSLRFFERTRTLSLASISVLLDSTLWALP